MGCPRSQVGECHGGQWSAGPNAADEDGRHQGLLGTWQGTFVGVAAARASMSWRENPRKFTPGVSRAERNRYGHGEDLSRQRLR